MNIRVALSLLLCWAVVAPTFADDDATADKAIHVKHENGDEKKNIATSVDDLTGQNVKSVQEASSGTDWGGLSRRSNGEKKSGGRKKGEAAGFDIGAMIKDGFGLGKRMVDEVVGSVQSFIETAVVKKDEEPANGLKKHWENLVGRVGEVVLKVTGQSEQRDKKDEKAKGESVETVLKVDPSKERKTRDSKDEKIDASQSTSTRAKRSISSNTSAMRKVMKSGQATVAETLNGGAAIQRILAQAQAETNKAKAELYKRQFRSNLFKNDFDDWIRLGAGRDIFGQVFSMPHRARLRPHVRPENGYVYGPRRNQGNGISDGIEHYHRGSKHYGGPNHAWQGRQHDHTWYRPHEDDYGHNMGSKSRFRPTFSGGVRNHGEGYRRNLNNDIVEVNTAKNKDTSAQGGRWSNVEHELETGNSNVNNVEIINTERNNNFGQWSHSEEEQKVGSWSSNYGNHDATTKNAVHANSQTTQTQGAVNFGTSELNDIRNGGPTDGGNNAGGNVYWEHGDAQVLTNGAQNDNAGGTWLDPSESIVGHGKIRRVGKVNTNDFVFTEAGSEGYAKSLENPSSSGRILVATNTNAAIDKHTAAAEISAQHQTAKNKYSDAAEHIEYAEANYREHSAAESTSVVNGRVTLDAHQSDRQKVAMDTSHAGQSTTIEENDQTSDISDPINGRNGIYWNYDDVIEDMGKWNKQGRYRDMVSVNSDMTSAPRRELNTNFKHLFSTDQVLADDNEEDLSSEETDIGFFNFFDHVDRPRKHYKIRTRRPPDSTEKDIEFNWSAEESDSGELITYVDLLPEDDGENADYVGLPAGTQLRNREKVTEYEDPLRRNEVQDDDLQNDSGVVGVHSQVEIAPLEDDPVDNGRRIGPGGASRRRGNNHLIDGASGNWKESDRSEFDIVTRRRTADTSVETLRNHLGQSITVDNTEGRHTSELLDVSNADVASSSAIVGSLEEERRANFKTDHAQGIRVSEEYADANSIGNVRNRVNNDGVYDSWHPHGERGRRPFRKHHPVQQLPDNQWKDLSIEEDYETEASNIDPIQTTVGIDNSAETIAVTATSQASSERDSLVRSVATTSSEKESSVQVNSKASAKSARKSMEHKHRSNEISQENSLSREIYANTEESNENASEQVDETIISAQSSATGIASSTVDTTNSSDNEDPRTITATEDTSDANIVLQTESEVLDDYTQGLAVSTSSQTDVLADKHTATTGKVEEAASDTIGESLMQTSEERSLDASIMHEHIDGAAKGSHRRLIDDSSRRAISIGKSVLETSDNSAERVSLAAQSSSESRESRKSSSEISRERSTEVASAKRVSAESSASASVNAQLVEGATLTDGVSLVSSSAGTSSAGLDPSDVTNIRTVGQESSESGGFSRASVVSAESQASAKSHASSEEHSSINAQAFTGASDVKMERGAFSKRREDERINEISATSSASAATRRLDTAIDSVSSAESYDSERQTSRGDLRRERAESGKIHIQRGKSFTDSIEESSAKEANSVESSAGVGSSAAATTTSQVETVENASAGSRQTSTEHQVGRQDLWVGQESDAHVLGEEVIELVEDDLSDDESSVASKRYNAQQSHERYESLVDRGRTSQKSIDTSAQASTSYEEHDSAGSSETVASAATELDVSRRRDRLNWHERNENRKTSSNLNSADRVSITMQEDPDYFTDSVNVASSEEYTRGSTMATASGSVMDASEDYEAGRDWNGNRVNQKYRNRGRGGSWKTASVEEISREEASALREGASAEARARGIRIMGSTRAEAAASAESATIAEAAASATSESVIQGIESGADPRENIIGTDDTYGDEASYAHPESNAHLKESDSRVRGFNNRRRGWHRHRGSFRDNEEYDRVIETVATSASFNDDDVDVEDLSVSRPLTSNGESSESRWDRIAQGGSSNILAPSEGSSRAFAAGMLNTATSERQTLASEVSGAESNAVSIANRREDASLLGEVLSGEVSFRKKARHFGIGEEREDSVAQDMRSIQVADRVDDSSEELDLENGSTTTDDAVNIPSPLSKTKDVWLVRNKWRQYENDNSEENDSSNIVVSEEDWTVDSTDVEQAARITESISEMRRGQDIRDTRIDRSDLETLASSESREWQDVSTLRNEDSQELSRERETHRASKERHTEVKGQAAASTILEVDSAETNEWVVDDSNLETSRDPFFSETHEEDASDFESWPSKELSQARRAHHISREENASAERRASAKVHATTEASQDVSAEAGAFTSAAAAAHNTASIETQQRDEWEVHSEQASRELSQETKVHRVQQDAEAEAVTTASSSVEVIDPAIALRDPALIKDQLVTLRDKLSALQSFLSAEESHEAQRRIDRVNLDSYMSDSSLTETERDSERFTDITDIAEEISRGVKTGSATILESEVDTVNTAESQQAEAWSSLREKTSSELLEGWQGHRVNSENTEAETIASAETLVDSSEGVIEEVDAGSVLIDSTADGLSSVESQRYKGASRVDAQISQELSSASTEEYASTDTNVGIQAESSEYSKESYQEVDIAKGVVQEDIKAVSSSGSQRQTNEMLETVNTVSLLDNDYKENLRGIRTDLSVQEIDDPYEQRVIMNDITTDALTTATASAEADSIVEVTTDAVSEVVSSESRRDENVSGVGAEISGELSREEEAHSFNGGAAAVSSASAETVVHSAETSRGISKDADIASELVNAAGGSQASASAEALTDTETSSLAFGSVDPSREELLQVASTQEQSAEASASASATSVTGAYSSETSQASEELVRGSKLTTSSTNNAVYSKASSESQQQSDVSVLASKESREISKEREVHHAESNAGAEILDSLSVGTEETQQSTESYQQAYEATENLISDEQNLYVDTSSTTLSQAEINAAPSPGVIGLVSQELAQASRAESLASELSSAVSAESRQDASAWRESHQGSHERRGHYVSTEQDVHAETSAAASTEAQRVVVGLAGLNHDTRKEDIEEYVTTDETRASVSTENDPYENVPSHTFHSSLDDIDKELVKNQLITLADRLSVLKSALSATDSSQYTENSEESFETNAPQQSSVSQQSQEESWERRQHRVNIKEENVGIQAASSAAVDSVARVSDASEVIRDGFYINSNELNIVGTDYPRDPGMWGQGETGSLQTGDTRRGISNGLDLETTVVTGASQVHQAVDRGYQESIDASTFNSDTSREISHDKKHRFNTEDTEVNSIAVASTKADASSVQSSGMTWETSEDLSFGGDSTQAAMDHQTITSTETHLEEDISSLASDRSRGVSREWNSHGVSIEEDPRVEATAFAADHSVASVIESTGVSDEISDETQAIASSNVYREDLSALRSESSREFSREDSARRVSEEEDVELQTDASSFIEVDPNTVQSFVTSNDVSDELIFGSNQRYSQDNAQSFASVETYEDVAASQYDISRETSYDKGRHRVDYPGSIDPLATVITSTETVEEEDLSTVLAEVSQETATEQDVEVETIASSSTEREAISQREVDSFNEINEELSVGRNLQNTEASAQAFTSSSFDPSNTITEELSIENNLQNSQANAQAFASVETNENMASAISQEMTTQQKVQTSASTSEENNSSYQQSLDLSTEISEEFGTGSNQQYSEAYSSASAGARVDDASLLGSETSQESEAISLAQTDASFTRLEDASREISQEWDTASSTLVETAAEGQAILSTEQQQEASLTQSEISQEVSNELESHRTEESVESLAIASAETDFNVDTLIETSTETDEQSAVGVTSIDPQVEEDALQTSRDITLDNLIGASTEIGGELDAATNVIYEAESLGTSSIALQQSEEVSSVESDISREVSLDSERYQTNTEQEVELEADAVASTSVDASTVQSSDRTIEISEELDAGSAAFTNERVESHTIGSVDAEQYENQSSLQSEISLESLERAESTAFASTEADVTSAFSTDDRSEVEWNSRSELTQTSAGASGIVSSEIDRTKDTSSLESEVSREWKRHRGSVEENVDMQEITVASSEVDPSFLAATETTEELDVASELAGANIHAFASAELHEREDVSDWKADASQEVKHHRGRHRTSFEESTEVDALSTAFAQTNTNLLDPVDVTSEISTELGTEGQSSNIINTIAIASSEILDEEDPSVLRSIISNDLSSENSQLYEDRTREEMTSKVKTFGSTESDFSNSLSTASVVSDEVNSESQFTSVSTESDSLATSENTVEDITDVDLGIGSQEIISDPFGSQTLVSDEISTEVDTTTTLTQGDTTATSVQDDIGSFVTGNSLLQDSSFAGLSSGYKHQKNSIEFERSDSQSSQASWEENISNTGAQRQIDASLLTTSSNSAEAVSDFSVVDVERDETVETSESTDATATVLVGVGETLDHEISGVEVTETDATSNAEVTATSTIDPEVNDPYNTSEETILDVTEGSIRRTDPIDNAVQTTIEQLESATVDAALEEIDEDNYEVHSTNAHKYVNREASSQGRTHSQDRSRERKVHSSRERKAQTSEDVQISAQNERQTLASDEIDILSDIDEDPRNLDVSVSTLTATDSGRQIGRFDDITQEISDEFQRDISVSGGRAVSASSREAGISIESDESIGSTEIEGHRFESHNRSDEEQLVDETIWLGGIEEPSVSTDATDQVAEESDQTVEITDRHRNRATSVESDIDVSASQISASNSERLESLMSEELRASREQSLESSRSSEIAAIHMASARGESSSSAEAVVRLESSLIDENRASKEISKERNEVDGSTVLGADSGDPTSSTLDGSLSNEDNEPTRPLPRTDYPGVESRSVETLEADEVAEEDSGSEESNQRKLALVPTKRGILLLPLTLEASVAADAADVPGLGPTSSEMMDTDSDLDASTRDLHPGTFIEPWDYSKTDIYIVRQPSRGPVRITHMKDGIPPLVSFRLIPKEVYEQVRSVIGQHQISYNAYPVGAAPVHL